MKRLQRIGNPGFTLVEMLVVISIIGILAGLVTVGAMAAIKAAKRALITTELSQMDMSLQNFRNKFGAYPPDGSVYPGTAFKDIYDADNNGIPDEFEQFFRTAFPNASLTGELDLLKTKYGITDKGYAMFFIDPKTNAPLYTPQTAMVFWLGGMPEDPRNPNSTPIGFSNNRINPLSDTASTSRLGPFYDFKPENLRNPPNATTSLLFRAYLSPVKTSTEEPIVYFRAEPGQRIGNLPAEYYIPGTVGNNPRMKAVRDPSTAATPQIRPYYDTRSSAFVNRSSFQILCAGLDGQFFTNNPPVTAANPDNRFLAFPTGVAGGNANLLPYDNANLDDQTNFIKGTIGDEMQ